MPSTPKTKPIAAKRKKTTAKGKRRAKEQLVFPHARIPVDDALRAAGFGELRFAEHFGLFMKRVSAKKGQEKLHLDGLKEWGRQFERSRPAERASGDPPVFIHLVHNVPRPERIARIQLPSPPEPSDAPALDHSSDTQDLEELAASPESVDL